MGIRIPRKAENGGVPHLPKPGRQGAPGFVLESGLTILLIPLPDPPIPLANPNPCSKAARAKVMSARARAQGSGSGSAPPCRRKPATRMEHPVSFRAKETAAPGQNRLAWGIYTVRQGKGAVPVKRAQPWANLR